MCLIMGKNSEINEKMIAIIWIAVSVSAVIATIVISVVSNPFNRMSIDMNNLVVSSSQAQFEASESVSATDTDADTPQNTSELLYPEYPYFIEVDLTNQITTIYTTSSSGKYDKVVRYMLCSTAQESEKFGEGYWKLKAYRCVSVHHPSIWHGMKSHGKQLHAQYITQISGDYLFHSVPYTDTRNNSLDVSRYKKLGTADSGGCIRLTVENAKWICENCKAGTTVHLVKKEKNQALTDALKEVLPMPDSSGWDPTDPNPKNPNYQPQYTDPDPKTEGYLKDNLGLNSIKYSAEKPRVVYND